MADNLNKCCWDFAADRVRNGTFGVVFGAPDFIDRLSRFLFPDRPAKRVKGLGCYDYELPDEYKDYPRCNF